MAISQNDPIKATEVAAALDKKVNTSDVLTLAEIKAAEDLTGKIADATAVRTTEFSSSRKIRFGRMVTLADGSVGFVICRAASTIHVVLAVAYFYGFSMSVIELYKSSWVSYTVSDNKITFSDGECVYIGDMG